MITFPNAKINIGLNVIEKRPDGFHNIHSCFYPVPWTDVLEIIESQELKFTASGGGIPGREEDNLCLKAYQLLKEKFDLPPVHIHLQKNIPIGAGLGGGSADASFTLKGLNDLFNLKLTSDELEKYAEKLGSDCPFFIKNKPVFVQGKGEQFDNINIDLSGKNLILVNPNIHISTKEAYAGVNPSPAKWEVKSVIKNTKLPNWKGKLKNDFEDSIFPIHPEIAVIKEQLYQLGAVYASMTGSGATVYGIFEEEVNIDLFPQNYKVWKGIL
ncbi:4-(cytidine 5'-diphospho)-2-C-methyl-D-erythritol kinase [Xanthovirga aplysinae]|uniref:4-(cytidine 5'-diphospho)-2-C-methyl-D-erythritol kinase n=1 Tax=Xanthovirga aplysinae TaxID=2529853 RepID=UPI0012BBCDA2|nr:4-(cytidine 5'-diphospho)-2-C-methyl-D-erythritol kinase [Xanthovirga aplysinae]MTI31814.1 4-(cytidine 5'-diphospho)-2-C-methyl-D-erythritol kinase [Xanthovirga aplysinae]